MGSKTKMNEKITQFILDKIRIKRSNSRTTKADIQRIIRAKETGDWREVYKSRLYRCHSSEYCELLQYIP